MSAWRVYLFFVVSATIAASAHANAQSNAGDLLILTDTDEADSLTLASDDLHRLKTATGLWGTYGYAYDPLNNLRSRTGPSALTYSYNVTTNRLSGISGSQTRTYSYNTRGEITGDGTKSFTLNAKGQINSITGLATYGYDGNGKRIKTVKGTTTEYALYDLAGHLVYSEQGTTKTDYLSLNGQTIVELKKTGSTTTPTYLHPDLLGSPRKATDASGSITWEEHYDPYGQKLNGVNEKIGYTGHAYDAESGLTYMQSRFYDPLVGGFLSTDPADFQDDNPFSFGRYAYANNNPYRYTDPNGQSPIEWVFIAGDAAELGGNLAAGNWGGAAWSAANLVLDVQPVPGLSEASHAVEAARAVEKGVDAARSVEKAEGAAAKAISGETKFTSAGRRAHAQEPLPPGFEREVTIPGTKLRMDGYNRETKQILEIKPNNSRAVQRGEKQLEKYCAACDKSELGVGHSSVPVQTYDPSKYMR